MFKTSDFDYKLPNELIAHSPADKRDQSRLMVLQRKEQSFEHKHFYNIIDFLEPGDLLVLNDTKVIPARLFGRKSSGFAKIEVFLTSRQPQYKNRQVWKCLVKPGKRLKVGGDVVFSHNKLRAKVLEKLESGEQILEFFSEQNFWDVVRELGQVPLPPYINAKPAKYADRYQTVYAKKEGASAAPTAGLHFTPELLEKLKKKGINIAYITLHTGLATFLPVRADNIIDHEMHREYFEIPQETCEALKKAKRVVAVGTTSVRALESMGENERGDSGNTDLFIYPGYKFKVVDAMITNFHWPKSTLIMLVSAFAQAEIETHDNFAGRDFILKAYEEAIKQKYRFYSFGDAMLIL